VNAARFLLSYCGFGYVPVAPGTAGTAGAALTAAAFLLWAPEVAESWRELCIAWAIAATALTVLLTPALEEADSVKDPQVIVTDEVAGYWVTLLGVAQADFTHLVAAFFVFRFFDIVKPWPANALERLPGGWGVALDDVAAGAYGAAVFWALEHFVR
jgi:phosphatidylglycerophosphatase A